MYLEIFIAWLMMSQRLPVLQRIGRFTQLQSLECFLCHMSNETHEHLFFTYNYVEDIWRRDLTYRGISLNVAGRDQCINSQKKMHLARRLKGVIFVIANAVIYHI